MFSGGSYSVTNEVASWGTLTDTTEVFKITPTKATITGAKSVVEGKNTSYYATKDTVVTVKANAPETGHRFDLWASEDVTFEDDTNATISKPYFDAGIYTDGSKQALNIILVGKNTIENETSPIAKAVPVWPRLRQE